MAKLEHADRQAENANPKVTLNGRTVDFGDRTFDAKTFARSFTKRKKRLTISQREAAQMKMETAVAQN